MLGRANCELLTPAIKECRLVSVCPPTARPPPITCTRQPRRAPFSGQLAHSLCAPDRNCNASPQPLFRSYVSHTYLFPRTTTTATGRTRPCVYRTYVPP